MQLNRVVALVVGALLAVSAAAVALPSQAADKAREHVDDRSDRSSEASSDADEASGDAGPSKHALFGLCTAWDNNAKGRENGQAGDAGPFQWLADLAGGAVEPFCGDVEPAR